MTEITELKLAESYLTQTDWEAVAKELLVEFNATIIACELGIENCISNDDFERIKERHTRRI